MPELVPDAMTMQESRVVEFPNVGVARKAVTPLAKVMLVCVQAELAPVLLAPDWGVPLPIIVMPIWLGTIMPALDQVQAPLGMLMTSPSTAVCVGPLMTAFTSLWLHEAAVYVAALNGKAESREQKAEMRMPFIKKEKTFSLLSDLCSLICLT